MSNNFETLDHEIQNVVNNPGLSPLKKYALLVIGEWSPWRLMCYELITALFGNWPGAAGYFLRRKFYQLLFKSMGKGVTIGRNVTFRGAGRISLGDNVCIDDNCVVDARGPQAFIVIGNGVFVGRNTIVRCRGENLTIGMETDIGCNCLVATDARLEIGRDVLISAYTYIAAGGTHRYDDKTKPINKQGFIRKGGSKIGNDVWIGAHSLILDGITIGQGAIIGAFSMVNESIPDMAIAFGTPAKIQRYR
jgi:acetyltransferase-like isoleucine patch superfamily enzyme